MGFGYVAISDELFQHMLTTGYKIGCEEDVKSIETIEGLPEEATLAGSRMGKVTYRSNGSIWFTSIQLIFEHNSFLGSIEEPQEVRVSMKYHEGAKDV